MMTYNPQSSFATCSPSLFLRSPLDICFIERFVHGIAQPGWIEADSRRTLDADSNPGSVRFVGQIRNGRERLEDLFSGGFECQCDPFLPTGGILYTAGTTGRPKGVLQTFGMVLYNALNIGLGIDLTSQDVSLNLLPCFHTGGLNMYANPTFHVGGTAIIQRAFDPAESLRLLSTEATAFFGVAANYLFMSQHPDFERTDLSHVRSWASGGSALPTSVLEAYARRGITIQQGFGMTETGPTVFLVDKEHALSKAGSVGKPQMHVQVRIVDGRGRDLPANQPGELLIQGPGVTPGYWQLPEVTAKAIEEGWLHSGDVARVDEEGYYYIVDRIKDMFISGGENVYPAEIENVIFQMPEVAEVTVISVPDPRWQEVGKAVVVLRPGASLSEQEVIAFCRARLAGYKTPKSVAFVERLPRNPAGKVLKNDVRGWFVQHGGGQETAAQRGKAGAE